MSKTKITLLSLVIVFVSLAKLNAQNSYHGDDKILHFGFSLGLNTMDFGVTPSLMDINSTVYHADVSRVIPGFMIQGGGMDTQLVEKQTRAPIQNESYNGVKNTRGTLAMARTNNPNSATSQFFINTADNGFLNKSPMNAGYAVFGKVIKGMDVVDKIEKVSTGNEGMHQNVPETPVVIQSVKIKAPAVKK